MGQRRLITELQVETEDWLAEQALANLGLRDEGIMVLGITRTDGRYIGAADGETFIRAGDTLILYGRAGVMEDLDQREPGFKGNMAHHQKIADQEKIERQEKKQDAG